MPSYLNYIKNKGQWNSKVLYQTNFRGGRLFLERNAFTYLFFPQDGLRQLHPHQDNNPETSGARVSAVSSGGDDAVTLNFHVVHMEFIGGNTNPLTQQLNAKEFYHNYYLGSDPKKWASKVPVSEGVFYPDLYNGVSLKAFSSNNNPRYDFTVNPAADASVIKMKFTGQDNLSIRDGKLIIGTSVGEMVQDAPFAYQETDGKQTKVNCRYSLKDNVVGIEITGNYNHNLPLIIDPTLVFATFTGSTADNWGMSASYDNLGNGYTAGICFGTGYPLTTGAFQATFAGGITDSTYDYMGFDIVTSKFNATGTNLLFSTYLGGSNNEQPASIIVDNNNNLLIYGRSYSTDFPVTAGAYDISLNGGADVIITKFNAAGTALIASTFVGGSDDDGVNFSGCETTRGSLKFNYADDGRGDIILDANNNIYIATCTKSTDFPVTAGCVQPANAGLQDGCVFKLNATLSALTWSTYFGGSANDAAYNLAIDNNNTVYFTGGTESPNLPTTTGALHSTYGGNIDGFLAHLSSNGNSLLQSTYIGTSSYDQSYFVQLDVSNNVYIYGQTSGSYPVTAGVYSNPNSGQFIHAFNPTLSTTIFSTVFGTGQGAPDIAPSAFLVDTCGNIYISGWGGILASWQDQNGVTHYYNQPASTTNGLPVTANAFQNHTDGMDFYFMVLKPNATALWYATYFGGDSGSEEHVDGGTSRFDKSGVIYQAICEGCAVNPATNYQVNQDMPTTPGAWSTTDQSNNCNNALVKFSFNLIQAQAVLSITPTTGQGCAPFPVSFTNQSQNATQYHWSFGDGTTDTTFNPSHTYTVAGTYSVQLAATNTTGCYSTDTILAVIKVWPLPAITVNSPTICAGTTTTLTATGASTYTWSANNVTVSSIQSPTVVTQYTVTGTSVHSCVSTATTSISVNPLPIVSASSSTICAGDTTTVTANGASTYTWNTSATTQSITIHPSTTTHYTVTGADSNNCKNIATSTITVNPLPVIIINHPSICIGNTATLTAGGASTYTWNTNDTTSSIVQSPVVTTHYTITATNVNACVKTATTSITVDPLPTISVNNDTICMGTNAILTAVGASTYTWSTGNTGTSVVLSPTVATNYTVTGTDIHSCVNTATVNISVNVTPIISVSNATICAGNTATLTASGGTTYTWSTSENVTSIMVSPIATTQYVVSSSNGLCTSSKTSTVSVVVNNTYIGSIASVVCTGDSLKLYTTSAYAAYNWNTGQTTASIEVTHAGTYFVNTIDNYGCKGMDSIKVSEDSPVAIQLQDATICDGQSVQLQLTQGSNYVYLWSPPFGLTNTGIYNPVAHPTTTTTYTASIANGPCISTNTVTIVVHPLPALSVQPKYSLVPEGENVTLHATSTDSCIWSPGDYLSCNNCNTTLSTPASDIIYTITATNNYNCSTVTTATVQVEIEATLYIPNTFTPNDDGLNDVFKAVCNHIHDLKMVIYDRWGLLIFQTNTIDQGWDGTYHGGKCQEDVYVYKLQYTDDPTNKSHNMAGQVTLLR
jgi:gliding motility-associated-like protein